MTTVTTVIEGKKSTSKSKKIKQIDKTWQVFDFKMKLHIAKQNHQTDGISE